MKNLKDNLDYIEQNLQKLFEEKLVRIFTGGKPQLKLIDGLISAMKNDLRDLGEEGIFAPNHFTINVPPGEMTNWLLHQDLLDQIAHALYQSGKENNLQFTNEPSIECKEDPNLTDQAYTIKASYSKKNVQRQDTASMPQSEQGTVEDNLPRNAFLVVGGTTNFPLDQTVVNIGRHTDNELVLDNPYVSRHHAQLRAINRQYIIFDVGSTGGIFINGRQMKQATLQAGDVIRIGLINLIYIQDTTSATPTTAIPIEQSEQMNKDQKS